MSEDGNNILKMVKQIRKLCEQVSLVLRTIDEQMDEKGWEAYNNTAKSYTDSLLSPKKWFPHEIFRFYTNEEYPYLLAYVSVLLDDDIDEEYEEELTEPLITAGCFDYGQGKHVSNNWKNWYWHARWYGYMKNRIDDGRIYASKENWQEDWGVEYPFQSYKCFGIPLISITNASNIESEIIKPLIELIPK